MRLHHALITALALSACSGADNGNDTDETDDTSTSDTSDTGDTGDTSDTGDTADTSDTSDTSDTGTGTPRVVINEFLASNDASWEDPQRPGEFPDAIELYNAGTAEADMSGWRIEDDKPEDGVDFPSGTKLAAGAFLVLIADDDEDTDAAVAGFPRLTFKLGAGGDTLTLLDDGDNVVDEVSWDKDDTDNAPFGDQATDVSAARTTDGAATWKTSDPPTIGSSNN